MAENIAGAIAFGMGLDNRQLQADARQASNILRGIGDSAVAEGSRIDNAYKQIVGIGSGLLMLQHAQAFIGQIVKVRGEIESLSISFETLLGSKQKADALFSQIKNFATQTPMELGPLAKGAQTLLSFNVEAEKVMPILRQIGDISMGSADKFNSLVLSFSQMSSTGKLMGQDLLQMINAGFNPLAIISEKTGKSISVLKEEMSAGAISSEMVADAFKAATDAGGKFHGMLERQSKGIEGSISNLHGAIDDMMNDLGTQGQGLITSAIAGATSIVENYEQIGKVIMDIVVAYGAYKAALIAINALQRLNIAILRQAVLEKRLAATAGIQLSNAEAVAAARTRLFTLAQQGLVKALNAAKAAMLANPAMLVAAAVAGLAFGIYKLVTAESAAEAAQRKHNEAMKAAAERKENLLSKTQQLISKLHDETLTIYQQIKAWKELQGAMPEEFGKMTFHEAKNIAPEEMNKRILNAADNREIAEVNKAVDDAQKRVDELRNSIRDADGRSGGMYIMVLGDQLKHAEEWLRLKKEAKDVQDETIRQAEFEAKPDAEKLEILGKQLQGYKDQYAEIEKLVPESERVADSMKKFVSPSIDNVGKGLFDVNKEWGKFDLQTHANIGTLNFLQGQINETVNTMDAISHANGAGMTYAQAKADAKKAYDDAKKFLEEIRKNGGKYSKVEYDNAVTDFEKAEKDYKALGGDTTKRKAPESSKPHDYSEQIEKERREKIQLYERLAFDTQQAEIDVMDDQFQKKLAQIELNHEKELTQIDKQKSEHLAHIQEWERTIWESENPDWKETKKEFTPTTTKLSVEDDTKYEKLFEAADKQRAQAINDLNKEAYETELRNYESFAQLYLAKVHEFNREIEDLQAKGVKEDIITGIKNMQAETLAGLDEEMGIMEQGFVTFVEELAVMGIQDLQAKLSELKDRLAAENASGGKDTQKIAMLNKQILALKKAINEVDKGKDPTEVKAPDIRARWKDVSAIIQDVGATTGELIDSFEDLDDSTKEILHSANNIATGTVKMIDGILKLSTGSMAAISGTAIGASAAISMVEKASIILTIITAAVQVVMAIINLFKGNHDKKKEKEIQQLQGQVDALEASYERLEKAIKKAYSGNAAEMIKQQGEINKQTIKLLEQQIKLEEEKKKTDQNKIQQYKDAIKDIKDELEEVNDRVIETMVGKSVKSAIDDFAEAYMDAWSAGEDKAAAMKDVVRQMVKASIAELVKSRLAKEVEAYMNYLSTAIEGGVLTVAEEQTLDYLEAAIYNKLNGFDSNLDKYIKEHTTDEEERQASSKGVESMSQDSANELNGRFTAIQALTYAINESIKILVANSAMILQVLMMIEVHTRSLARLGDMQADIRALKNTLGDIALKGITVKK